MDEGPQIETIPWILAAGELVDHFEIIELLGSGGMGEVYLAKDTKLSRKVALKVVRSPAFDDQAALERFLYEAKITARFNHPHIVTAYSVGEHQGHPYVALEYLQGDTLRQRMDREHIEVREAMEIALAVARALTEAHAHRILHRDLKPENVVIPVDGRVRVLDFGLARAVPQTKTSRPDAAETEPAISRDSLYARFEDDEGGFTGTPYYMAPEQWQSEPATAASDVWALGVILYEMLAGARPFTGPTIFVLGAKVVSNDPTPPLPTSAQVPAELADLVARCLDKDPEHRPSAEVLSQELERLIREGPQPAKNKARWPRWALVTVLIATLIGAVVVGWAQWGRNRPAWGIDQDGADSGGGPLLADRFPPRMHSDRDLLRIGTSELSLILGSEIAPAVFWGLLHHEPDGRAVPVLIDERPTLENGGARPAPGGGIEVTWQLFPGLRWSDGHELTAGDLVFSLEVFPEPHLVEARAPDDRTLVVRWSDQVAEALGSIRPLPRHVLGPVFQEGGVDAVAEYLRIRPTPVIGPYRVTTFRPDDLLVLEANPYFIGPPPSIRRVEIHRARPEELIERFRAGRIDMIFPDVLSLHQAEGLIESHPQAVHIRPSSTLVALQPDLENRTLRRREVRQALMHAIDRARLVTEVYRAEGRIAHVPQQAPLPTGVEIYGHDTAQAAAALERAGAAGYTFLLLHGNSDTDRRIAALLAEDFEDAGVHLEARASSAGILESLRQSGHHGGLLLEYLPVSRRQSPVPFLNVPRESGGFDLSVRHDAFDDRMAALVDREARSLVPQRRSELRDSIWVRWSTDLPLLPLAFAAERVVVHPALRGWDSRPGVRFGRGLEWWYFVAEPGAGQANARAAGDDPED